MESKTVQELSELPTVLSVVHFFKNNGIFSVTIRPASDVINFVDDKITGTSLDNYVGDRLACIKDDYPLLMKKPGKILKKSKSRSTKFCKRKVRALLNNFVGNCLILCLDTCTIIAENTLRFLEPTRRAEPRVRSVAFKDTSEKAGQTGIKTSKSSSTKGQTSASGTDYGWADRIAVDNEESLLYYLIMTLLFPLHILVSILQTTQGFVKPSSQWSPTSRQQRRKSSRVIKPKPLSPTQLQVISSRRRVSPMKRINYTFFGNIKNSALRMLGFEDMASQLKQTDIRQFMNACQHKDVKDCTVKCKSIRKRKLSDIMDYSESEEDLTNLDLENYHSEEDPDYEPSEDESESDDTSDTSEPEEELEVEQVSEELVQLKEAKGLKVGLVQSPTSKLKPETSKIDKIEKMEPKAEKQQSSSAPAKISSPKPKFLSPKLPHAPSSIADSPKRGPSLINDPPSKTAQNTTPTTTQSKSTQNEGSDGGSKSTDQKLKSSLNTEKVSGKEDYPGVKSDHSKNKSKEAEKEVLKEQTNNKENVIRKIDSKDIKVLKKNSL